MSRRSWETLIGLAIMAIPNLNRIARFFERLFAWVVDAPQALGKTAPMLTGDFVAWGMMAIGLAVVIIANLPQRYRAWFPRPFRAHFYDLQPPEGSRSEISGISERLTEIDSDLLKLFDYCTHNLRYQMLVLLYRQAPPDIDDHFDKATVTVAWIEEQMRMALEYIDWVSVSLSGTNLAIDLDTAKQSGESEGERRVSIMSPDDRPAHIDPYKFLNYAVARTQYSEVMIFLSSRIREDEKKMKNDLMTLRKRLQERNNQS